MSEGPASQRPDRSALERLSRLGALIASERDPERVIQRVTDEATALVRAQFGAFFSCGGVEAWVLHTLSGGSREVFASLAMPRSTEVFGASLAGEGILRSADISKDPRYGQSSPHEGLLGGHLPVRSYLALPVKSITGELLGGLVFCHAEAGVFDEAAERALSALAPIAGTALSNARLFVSLTRSEAELRLSEARYRLVSEATQEGVWFWDVVEDQVEWNDRLLELMGVKREDWGGTFQDWFARLHPDDQPIMSLALKEHLERRVPYRVEPFRLRHADGEYRWCTTAGQAEWDEAGQPVRMAGSFRDVHDQKVAEDRLRESEHRLAQILDSVQDMIFTKNERLQVTWANVAACRYYGMNVEQLRQVADASPEGFDFAQPYSRDDRDVFETGCAVERSEEPNVSPSGEPRVFHTVKTPIKDTEGKVVELVGVARDVTERARELEGQRLLAQASAIFGASLDYEATLANVARSAVPTFADWSAVDLLDEDGQPRRVAVHHWDPEKVALAHELHARYPPDMQASHGLAHVLKTQQIEHASHITDEVLVQSAKSPEHLAQVRALGLCAYVIAPIVVAERSVGAISFVSAESRRRYTASDVAFAAELARRAAVAIENARLYRQVQELASTLERRVEQRTAALLEANQELEAFSYTVSHDLRAPVRHMGGFADLLRVAAGSALEPKALHYLDTIKTSATQMGALIDGLLSFSRLGRVDLRKGRVDPNELVAKVIQELEPDLLERRVQFEVGALPMLSADPTMLKLVLVNLVSNAVKYTRARPEAQIGIGGRIEGGEPVIWVKDNGVGFEMEYVQKLFGVFQRLHTQEQFEGTGIGLATVRRIVHRHGGRVWAEGEPGVGATFYFTLPAEGAEPPSGTG